MDDLISRQAAIELIKSYCENGCDIAEDNWCPSCQREQFIELLKALPSAQSERPKGKWTPHRETSREYIGTTLINVSYDYWFCDACGYRVEKGQPMYNFCPNCGADMRGEA